MLVTTVDEARSSRDLGRGAQIPYYVRHWSCAFGLASADLVSFLIAALLFRVWSNEPKIWIGQPWVGGTPVDLFAVSAVIFIVLRAIAGDYSRREPFWDGARTIIQSAALISLPDMFAVVLRHSHYSATGTIGSWVAVVFILPTLRQVARKALSGFGLWQRRTVLIGSGKLAEAAFTTLGRYLSLGFDIQWVVTVGTPADISGGLSKLKTVASADARDAALLVQAAGCDQAILAMEDAHQSLYPDFVQSLSEADVETAIVPSLARLPLGNLTTNVMFGQNIFLFHVRDNLRRWPQRVLKRIFDFVGAIFGLVVLSPFFLVIAALVRRQDGGPVTYSQIRVGRDGVPFRCIKFRTMVDDADELLARWQTENVGLFEEYQKTHKLRDDPRVTPLGRWLRRTSLDELPQLVNILRGEMSFVGPRPVVERELIEFYGPAGQLYMRVRPGLTGLWQVSGRSDTGYDERIAFDEWYILNWSFWYDLVIIVQTFGVMVSGNGAY